MDSLLPYVVAAGRTRGHRLGAVPALGRRPLMIYGNATYPDQVRGIPTRLKRGVRRGRVEKRLRAQFERFRQDINDRS